MRPHTLQLLQKSDRTFTICGAPEYLAPEQIIGEKGHGLPADWWAFGALLYTLRCGKPAFESPQKVVQFFSDSLENGLHKVPATSFNPLSRASWP